MGRDTRCKVPRLTAGTMYMVRVKVCGSISSSSGAQHLIQAFLCLNPDEDSFSSQTLAEEKLVQTCIALHALHEMLCCMCWLASTI